MLFQKQNTRSASQKQNRHFVPTQGDCCGNPTPVTLRRNQPLHTHPSFIASCMSSFTTFVSSKVSNISITWSPRPPYYPSNISCSPHLCNLSSFLLILYPVLLSLLTQLIPSLSPKVISPKTCKISCHNVLVISFVANDVFTSSVLLLHPHTHSSRALGNIPTIN